MLVALLTSMLGLLVIMNAFMGLVMRQLRVIPFLTGIPALITKREEEPFRFYLQVMGSFLAGLGLVMMGMGSMT